MNDLLFVLRDKTQSHRVLASSIDFTIARKYSLGRRMSRPESAQDSMSIADVTSVINLEDFETWDGVCRFWSLPVTPTLDRTARSHFPPYRVLGTHVHCSRGDSDSISLRRLNLLCVSILSPTLDRIDPDLDMPSGQLTNLLKNTVSAGKRYRSIAIELGGPAAVLLLPREIPNST